MARHRDLRDPVHGFIRIEDRECFAAKTFWILEQNGQTMTPDGIAEAAKQFRWSVNGQEVTKAPAFLQKLDLARVTTAPVSCL